MQSVNSFIAEYIRKRCETVQEFYFIDVEQMRTMTTPTRTYKDTYYWCTLCNQRIDFNDMAVAKHIVDKHQ